jgi:hypothetical protein
MRFQTLLQIRIDLELYDALVTRAVRDKTTVSHLVRAACRKEYMRGKK